MRVYWIQPAFTYLKLLMEMPKLLCVNLRIETSEQSHWRHFDVFIVNFEQVSHIILVFH